MTDELPGMWDYSDFTGGKTEDQYDCPTHPGIECEYNTNDDGTPECPCMSDCCAIAEIDFSPEEDTE